MKKTLNAEWLQGLQELRGEEMSEIVAGESLWYWVAYAVGKVIYTVENASGTQTSGQKLMNAALG